MKILRFAAIDIGTNAIRLLFTNIIENGDGAIFKKSSITRVPIRLGTDVFTTGKISDKQAEKLTHAMIAFKHLMSVHDVVKYKACATSAMREASNAKKIIRSVKNKSGIEIDVIDGKTEAEIIYNNRIVDALDHNYPYLYVDIGGGSTEVTLFSGPKVIKSYSFNIGTIRLLNELVAPSETDLLKEWLSDIKNSYPDLKIIGSGGNINKLLKISGKKELKPLPVKTLKDVYEYIKSYNYEDRIKILGLNPDRADVIIPASDLLFKIVKWSGAKEIIVPKIGIADGIIKQIYKEYLEENNFSAKIN
ncbi:MAG TPA: Ppx/GppA family phosphatase [Bacteroidales bacterium]|nr:Ppx/GppA family phosphatase [Bacteroidales bacterium]